MTLLWSMSLKEMTENLGEMFLIVFSQEIR